MGSSLYDPFRAHPNQPPSAIGRPQQRRSGDARLVAEMPHFRNRGECGQKRSGSLMVSDYVLGGGTAATPARELSDSMQSLR